MNAADPYGLVGQVLDGQFRVDKLVGEGGFSTVYRGHHQGLNEPIAIKCLKLPAALGTSLVDTFVQRFRDESRILYRLSQGNLHIVRSIAAGTTQAPATGALVPYMVLEWLEGRSLQNDFTVRRTLGEKGRSIEEVMKLFDTAADGLAYAHAQGVVHRDLNPGNLFLANTHHGMKMKVLDFGVAKLMHDSALNLGPRAQTVGQIKIFAPAYGAPEQFDDRIGAVSAASDVYSFALVLMEALRDRNVVEGTHLGEFAQATTDPDKRPTPRSLGLTVPDEIEQAFARATALDPAKRWHSAGDFWQSLTIALKFATERKYENAARETPPLAMSPKQQMSKTMPLNATSPFAAALPRPTGGLPGASASGAPRPRVPTTIGIPLAPGAGSGPTPPSTRGANLANAAAAASASSGADAPSSAGSTAPNATPLVPPPIGAPLSPPRATARPPAAGRSPSMPNLPRLGTPQPMVRPAAPQPMARPAAPTARFPGDDAPPPGSRRTGTMPDIAPLQSPQASTTSASDGYDAQDDEEEDEATKVHAPGADVLRTLALQDAVNVQNARAAANAAAAAQGRSPEPRPGAPRTDANDETMALEAAARDAAMSPPPGVRGEAPRPPAATPVPPSHGGTLMMAPAAHAATLKAAQERAAQAGQTPAAQPSPAQGPRVVGGGLGSTVMMPQRHNTPGLAFTPPPPAVQAAQVTEPMQMQHLQHGMQGSQIVPSQGQASRGQAPQGQAPQGQTPQGQAPQGQAPQGQAPIGAQSAPFGPRPAEPPFPPPSYAQLPAAERAQKPLPVLPIAIGLGMLALGGIILGVFALRARHATPDPNAPIASAASSETATLTPVPVPVPEPAEAPTVPSVAAVDVDASPAVAEEAPDATAPPATAEAPSAAPSASAAVGAANGAPTTAASGPQYTWPPPSAATAVPVPKPTADPNAFNEGAARSRLGVASGVLIICKKEGGVTGPGNASVTFAPDGTVGAVSVDPPFAGTPAGDCVAGQFRRVKINPFTGTAQTVRYGFEVPK